MKFRPYSEPLTMRLPLASSSIRAPLSLQGRQAEYDGAQANLRTASGREQTELRPRVDFLNFLEPPQKTANAKPQECVRAIVFKGVDNH
jgi:hypothetical protein